MADRETAEDVLGERTQPGAAGAGLGGGMESGATAGSGDGRVEDVDPETDARRSAMSNDGPPGGQDSSGGDLGEAGE